LLCPSELSTHMPIRRRVLALFVLVWAVGASAAGETTVEPAAMLRLLETGTVQEQIEAARWLGLNGVEEARDPLIRLSTLKPRDDREEVLVRTSRLMYDLIRKPELLRFRTEDEVLDGLDDSDPRTRADALRHVTYFELQSALPRVRDRLSDDDALVREEALVTLTHLGAAGLREPAIGLLGDPEGAVRLRAFEYLLSLGDPTVMDRLIELVDDPDVWVARPVVRKLSSGRRADEALDALLAGAVRSKEFDRTVRYLEALARFPAIDTWRPEQQEALRSFLSADEAGTRLAAALLWVDMAPETARPLLVEALSSESPEDRRAAVGGLSRLPDPPDRSLIERLLHDSDFEVRRAAVTLALELAPRQRRRVYLAVLERPGEHEEVLTLVMAHFPDVGTEADVDLLLRYAVEADSDFLRINAVTALALLEERTLTRRGHELYSEVLTDREAAETLKSTVLNAVQLVGDASYLDLLGDELRNCSTDDAAYAAALSKTISILLGRMLHGEDYGVEEAR